MRAAPGLLERIRPWLSSTSTPAVRLSKIACRLARAASTWLMLCCTADRASESCCVMSANERVSPPNSSLLLSTSLGRRSPCATWRTPSASSKSGRANWVPSSTASNTAPNTARNRLRVSVPMYILRRPLRASARSWYSRLASCTAMALATSSGGRSSAACKNRSLLLSPKLESVTNASARMRAVGADAAEPADSVSSKPSIWVATRCVRASRNCCAEGRSGCKIKRDWPALEISCPEAPHSNRSLAPICSRNRSSAKPGEGSLAKDICVAA